MTPKYLPRLPALSVLLAALAGASQASTVYSNSAAWQAAVAGGATTLSFDDQDYSGSGGNNPLGTSLYLEGVDFTSNSAGTLWGRAPSYSGDAGYQTSNYLGVQTLSLGLAFPGPILAFSLDIGETNGFLRHYTITLSNGEAYSFWNGALLQFDGNDFYTFFGVVSDTPFDSLTITASAVVTGLDNVAYGPLASQVPEPATAALLLAGLGLLGRQARRRR